MIHFIVLHCCLLVCVEDVKDKSISITFSWSQELGIQKILDQKIKILDFQYIKRTSSIKKFLQSKRLWFFFLLSLRWIKNSDLDCNHKIMITQLQQQKENFVQQNVQKFKDLKFVSWTHQSKRIENYESSSQHQ